MLLNRLEFRKCYIRLFLSLLPLVLAPAAFAGSDTDLAKQSQNPVANMISLPFENNVNFDYGPSGKRMYTTNIKPVYPMPIGKNLNLINRLVAPVMYLEGQDSMDITPNQEVDIGGSLVSPAKPGKIILGVGPVLELPTNTDSALGTDTWFALVSSR